MHLLPEAQGNRLAVYVDYTTNDDGTVTMTFLFGTLFQPTGFGDVYFHEKYQSWAREETFASPELAQAFLGEHHKASRKLERALIYGES